MPTANSDVGDDSVSDDRDDDDDWRRDAVVPVVMMMLNANGHGCDGETSK